VTRVAGEKRGRLVKVAKKTVATVARSKFDDGVTV